jgi:hypothetical protein
MGKCYAATTWVGRRATSGGTSARRRPADQMQIALGVDDRPQRDPN